MAGKFYVTTPIYYVNDRPHIGHVYTTMAADVIARHHRLRGEDVFFLTGTDEHAQKVVEAARERGLAPQEWADRNADAFRSCFQRLAVTHDDFIRTSESRHKERVRRYVAELREAGVVYLGEYEGWYDAGQEEYVAESRARAWNYTSPTTGKALVRKREENYFFRLSAFQDALLELFERDPGFVQPEARRNEIVARVREGLNDVPISRTAVEDWGIRMPGDAGETGEAHTIYVWIDALFNYVSAIDRDDRRGYWPADVHLIAKDILWFHAVIWPAVLMALGKRPGLEWLELPKRVYAHSFWIAEGQKMSKSLGNFIDLEKIDGYVAEYGLDALRYFLAKNGPMGTTDADFAEAIFVDTYNHDLANTIGNCLNRIANMTARYFDGALPAPQADPGELGKLEGEPAPDLAAACVARHRRAMDGLELTDATDAALSLVRAVNAYIDRHEPFRLAKDPQQLPAVGTILYQCAEAMRIATVLLWPLLPEKAEEAWRRLGCSAYAEAVANGRGAFDAWAQWGGLEPGTPIAQGPPLFPRKRG